MASVCSYARRGITAAMERAAPRYAKRPTPETRQGSFLLASFLVCQFDRRDDVGLLGRIAEVDALFFGQLLEVAEAEKLNIW